MTARPRVLVTRNVLFWFHALLTIGALLLVLLAPLATHESVLLGLFMAAAYVVVPFLCFAIPIVFLLSLQYWRDWEVVVPASLLLLSLILVLVLKEVHWVRIVVGVAYLGLAAVTSLRWFVVHRRRERGMEVSGESRRRL